MVSPALERIAHAYAGRVKVVKVNTDSEPALAQRYRVQGIPLIVLMRDGVEIDRRVGAVPEAQLSLVAQRPSGGPPRLTSISCSTTTSRAPTRTASDVRQIGPSASMPSPVRIISRQVVLHPGSGSTNSSGS